MTVNKPHLTVCAPSYFSNRNLWSGLTRLTVSDNAGGDISFKFNDVSSGGNAMLVFLAGDKLPGLETLKNGNRN